MARPTPAFLAASEDYVCVRITDMQAIDMERYRFDFDLTLAVLLANADGTVYHRIGGRTREDPLAWMSMEFVVRVMREGLETHRQHKGRETPLPEKRTVYDIPAFRAKFAGKKRPDCIHCHTLHEAATRNAQSAGTFQARDRFVWPAPSTVGLRMTPRDQALVAAVTPDSIAARAGLRAGDRLERLGDQRILTVHDIQWVLHRAPYAGGKLVGRARRDGRAREVVLELSDGFKVTDALTYSWRPFKWALRPAPGFGGRMIDRATKAGLGLPANAWAFRVQYIVDWGDRPQQGRANRRAGLRKGDVVYSYAGKRDFINLDHFHAWVRFHCKRGQRVAIELFRGTEKRTLHVKLL